MSAPTNYPKLGLFVVLGFVGVVSATVVSGVAGMRKETTKYHSFFNESVQGLDVGSAVKFRGVTIGHVSAIEIAPDHRLVDVVSELDVEEIKRLGLSEAAKVNRKTKFSIPPDLRAQLGSQGMTGVKVIAIDFFDVKSTPPMVLPFETPERYIPATPSMMKGLEDTITKAMDRLPDMVDAVVMIMGRVDRMLAILERDDVAGKVGLTMARADDVLNTMQGMLQRIDRAHLGEKTAAMIEQLQGALAKMDHVLDRVDGKDGLLASAKSATDAFGEMGKNGHGTQRDLEATLRDVSDAAEAIRSLASAIERDPDMLLKGKSKESPKAQR